MNWGEVILPLSLTIPKEFTTENWVWLLSNQPQFFDKCDLNKFSQADIKFLLEYHPDLEKYIPKK